MGMSGSASFQSVKNSDANCYFGGATFCQFSDFTNGCILNLVWQGDLKKNRTQPTARSAPAPGSFLFKVNARRNMSAEATARTLNVSTYAKVAACT